MQPNKSDALSYLNSGAAAPVRYARAVIQFGATLEPYIQEYQVGPLPVVNGSTTLASLDSIYNKGKGYIRVYDQDSVALVAFSYQISTGIADITQSLLNGVSRCPTHVNRANSLEKTALGAPNDTLAIAGSAPLTFEDDKVFQWNQFYSINTTPCLDEYLLQSGLEFKTDITGRDPAKWSVVAWQYNGIFYESETAFRQALNSSTFTRPGPNSDGPWACTDYNGGSFPHDELNPPVPVQPDGPRFAVDEQEGYIEWSTSTKSLEKSSEYPS